MLPRLSIEKLVVYTINCQRFSDYYTVEIKALFFHCECIIFTQKEVYLCVDESVNASQTSIMLCRAI